MAFVLNGETIFVQAGRCARADGTLAGAYLDMAQAVRNSVRSLHVPLTEALQLASTNPAEFLGLGDKLGKLAPGFRADMVALDGASLEVLQTWVVGAAVNKLPHQAAQRSGYP
jgi:N-acetylglucosamine-6-phosphate deacetylase